MKTKDPATSEQPAATGAGHSGEAATAAPDGTGRPGLNRFLLPLGIFVALALILALGIAHSYKVGVINSPLVGKRGPAWSLPVFGDAGRTVGSQDFRGQWYVLNVWGSWCPTCREEHETLLRIAGKSTVPIIGIDWRDDDADARNWLAQLGNPYTTVASDHDGRVAIDWGVSAAPETFLVNPEGIIVYKQIGAMTDSVWQKEFAPHLPPRRAGGTS